MDIKQVLGLACKMVELPSNIHFKNMLGTKIQVEELYPLTNKL
jgi:hypothetical protein